MINIEGKVKFSTEDKVNVEESNMQAVSTDYCFIKYWVTNHTLYIQSDEFDVSLLTTDSFPLWIKFQCEKIKEKFQ